MDQYDSGENDVSMEVCMRVIKIVKSKGLNKCYQCEFTTIPASAWRRHLKTHSGEKCYKYIILTPNATQVGN